jgi:hypothetical protein
MISSQDGTEARRGLPLTAFLAAGAATATSSGSAWMASWLGSARMRSDVDSAAEAGSGPGVGARLPSRGLADMAGLRRSTPRTSSAC